MDAVGPDEIVHVTETGKYFDHVYRCDHEKLYSLDDLDDPEALARLGLRGDRYAKLSPQRRIETMPFFRAPLASSLKAFLAGIRIVDRSAKPATAPSTAYLECARPPKFWMGTVSGPGLVIRSGRRGARGTTRIERCSSEAQARAELAALVADMETRGYRARRLRNRI